MVVYVGPSGYVVAFKNLNPKPSEGYSLIQGFGSLWVLGRTVSSASPADRCQRIRGREIRKRVFPFPVGLGFRV